MFAVDGIQYTAYREDEMRIERFEQLEVWKTARGLMLSVYRMTRNVPGG
jgi:hypothetical protein